MSTHSIGHQSSGLGFATFLLGKPKTHRRMEKTHFQLGEDEILLYSSLPKTLSKLERKYPKKYYFIVKIKINVQLLKINNNFSIYRLQKIVLADLSARLVGIAD
ncbi:hypothetical protein H5410_036940 [Solanum commersonii]|uniref:Uncharacterized protein n=1 Tax=Solanum commersonii TaxID=4109 RepID=A0A9J5Y8V1_SOLCO|nr:hypothetical protein H5410_036940 [Solanum commersonii]